MVLGNFPTNFDKVWHGHSVLAAGAIGGCWIFLLSSIFSLPFLPVSGRRPDTD